MSAIRAFRQQALSVRSLQDYYAVDLLLRVLRVLRGSERSDIMAA